MNKSIHWTALLLAGLLSLDGLAHAQPPDVVQSDISGNTAMGTKALASQPTGTLGEFNNTAAGISALSSNTDGYDNTAIGAGALESSNSSGNTAVGVGSMVVTTTGYDNTAIGAFTLWHNTTGFWNTAAGLNSLSFNTTGNDNTASGVNSMQLNLSGANNVATGFEALGSNTVGNNNTASGSASLFSNINGNSNTAAGLQSLYYNTAGSHNSGFGTQSLFSNTTGLSNVAAGYRALYSNQLGSSNIALGVQAGYLITGSNNVDIANQGAAGESGTIRIGTAATQTKVFISGIATSKVTGSAVYVTSSGQLGVLASSERYKTAIAPMGTATDRLRRLRPVSFHLKSDAQGPVQYGLIAEEVNEVYPELVIRDDDGKIQGVRYDELAPMLLNEMQKQNAQMARQFAEQTATIGSQAAEIRDLRDQLARVSRLDEQVSELRAALASIQAREPLVALGR